MIILIGGVSCTGKTLLAQRLLEKYQIPYLSIDHLKMGLIRGGSYCDFSVDDPDEAITWKLWPVVKGIILTAIENGQHLIIEGCYIPPEELHNFEPETLDQIIALYIGFSPRYLEQNFSSGIVAHRNAIERKDVVEDDGYVNLPHFRDLHARQKERCLMNGATFFEIDTNYETEMQQILQWIDAQIQAKMEVTS